MSKGRQIIGRSPADYNTEAKAIRDKAIELIDLIEEHGKNPRCKTLSIDHIEMGAMLAVKSVFEE